MYDISLMKKLSDKALWTRLSPYIKEHAVSKETWNIMSSINNYYRTYPSATEIHWSDFAFFFFTIKKLKSEEYDNYRTYFDNVEKAEDSAVLEDVLKNYVVKDYATQIMNVAMKVCTDEAVSMDDIQELMDKYKKEIVTTVEKENVFVPTGLSTTLSTVATGGFNWRLNEMNISAGPLRTGDFVILAARPETGKTTFIASELSYFATQLKDDRPIVWVNNEEGGSKVMNRVIQSYFGVPLSSLIEHEAEYDERYKKEVGDRIRIINDDAGLNNVRKLTALFEEVNPSIIVFDQLDKVHGFEKEARDDLRLGKLYEWARNLAKKYGPTIAVSQASEAADYVHYITLSMLRGSKTDKAGEADLIITLGRDKEDEYKRYLHLPKNKLWGSSATLEAHRHGKFEVSIQPEIARYKGVF